MSVRTVLAGGSLFDVRSGTTFEGDLVLEHARIDQVGLGLDGDSLVDCTGCVVFPGFIDCHTHVALSEHLAAANPYRLARSTLALSAVPVLRTLLRLGVTTVRDAWGADAGLRLAIERGWVEGPQILISLRQVCTTAGLGDRWMAHLGQLPNHDPSLPNPVFDGPDGGRAAVRRMVRAGADWIKVAATGSLHDGQRAHDVQMTTQELAAVVDEAARQGGRRVMVHAHGARAAQMAAKAGARSVEHGVWLDEEAITAMKTAGTWLVPTLSVTQADPDGLVPGAAEAHRRSVRMAIEAGVSIALGSDSPVRPHGEVLEELRYLADSGLGVAGAFRAATFDAARLLGLGDDRGEIAAGKRADLVAVTGTALDCSDLDARISHVWHNGRRIERLPRCRRDSQ